MKTVANYNFNHKKALVRVDFNVPLDENYQITDDTRITAALPTINKILSDGGAAILMSHLGRPKSGPEEKFSLKHLTKYLSEKLGVKVNFADDCVGSEAQTAVANLKEGEVLVLENLRFHPQETKGDREFAQALSKLGDVYVDDAFGTAHRAHASTSVVAQFFKDKVAGYVMQAELENADRVLKQGQKPLTAIMGGAKISDKILIIEKLLDKVGNLIVGGGMCYTFFKALGGKIGNSLVEEDKLELALNLIQKAKSQQVELILPKDSVVADEFSNQANRQVADNFAIPDSWMGLGIGPEARMVFGAVIKNSRTILWNGPMGVFEMSNFAKGTISVAEAVVEATANGAYSLIGGGDSAAAVNSLGFGSQVSYVSTGGGALLEYMEGKALPGVVALED